MDCEWTAIAWCGASQTTQRLIEGCGFLPLTSEGFGSVLVDSQWDLSSRSVGSQSFSEPQETIRLVSNFDKQEPTVPELNIITKEV